MTLDEALNTEPGNLLRLVAFHGFKPCGRLTGRYYYNSLIDKEDEKDIYVEVYAGWLKKEWVPLMHLKQIKERI